MSDNAGSHALSGLWVARAAAAERDGRLRCRSITDDVILIVGHEVGASRSDPHSDP